MEHSSIGGSSCHRYWECPGSVNLQKGIEDTPSLAAATGKVAHTIAEAVLKELKAGKKPDPFRFIGDTMMEGDFEIEVTEEMAEAVEVFLTAILSDLKKHNASISDLEVEKHFKLEVDKHAFGTCDAVLYIPFEIIKVYDFKYGQGVVVEVQDNKQLMFYSLGALLGKDVSSVEHVIVQPRAYHPDGPVRRANYSIKQIFDFEYELKEKIMATRKSDAPLKAGSWCKFCRAIPICPELKKEALQIAKEDFSKVAQLPDPVLIKFLNMQERMVSFLKEVCSHLQKKAESGVEIPGWKLVKARSNRKWKNESRLIHAFKSTKYGDKLTISKLKSPSELDKVFKKERDLLLPYIEKPDNGLTLVKESDPRISVKSSAESDFEDY